MVWAPQPGPQTEAISADWCPELLYGGAAGGGKSDYLIGDYLQDVDTYGAAWRGVIFRRTYPELEELLARSLELYPSTGAEWFEAKRQWVWPNGATLKMRYLESDRDVLRYQGHQYTWIGWDELTQWPSLYAYNYMRSRLRSAHPVPTKRIRAACNPGGPGHNSVKGYFIDPCRTGFTPIMDETTRLERMFIPAKLRDNRILVQADPDYEARMRGLGNDALVRALLDGDWDIIEGAFFSEFAMQRHVVEPFSVPDHWLRFRSGDWGSARPFSIGWWAVASEQVTVAGAGGRHKVTIPRGAIIRYREWYGAREPNVGLKLPAEDVAQGIREREAGDKIGYGVIDPAAFSSDGGPSIAERMATKGVMWRRADNSRVAQRGAMGGWDVMRARIRGDEDGRPMIFWFSTCHASIRTIPALQHDQSRPEDLDTNGEDHAADETRYACLSRPWVASTPKPKTAPAVDPRLPTLDEIVREHDRKRQGAASRI